MSLSARRRCVTEGLVAIESSSMAGTVGLAGGVMAAAYCWVHGDEDGDGVVNKTDDCPGTPKGTMVDAGGHAW